MATTATFMRLVPGPIRPRMPPVPNSRSWWKASNRSVGSGLSSMLRTAVRVSCSYGSRVQASALARMASVFMGQIQEGSVMANFAPKQRSSACSHEMGGFFSRAKNARSSNLL